MRDTDGDRYYIVNMRSSEGEPRNIRLAIAQLRRLNGKEVRKLDEKST